MINRFQIIIGSPLNYKKLVAYVVIDGQHLALINQEEGKDKMKIEFFEEPKIKELDFNVFLDALQEAKRELLK